MRRIGVWAISLIAWCPLLPAFAAPEAVTLHLKWYHQFQFAGYYAAQAQGYYAAEGLTVRIQPSGPSGEAPMDALLAGRAEYCISDSEVLLQRLKGEPLVVGAAIFQHSPYVILSRRDRGIRTPSDLVGKTVAMAANQGAAELRAMMRQEGIDPDLVTYVPLIRDLAPLVDGRIDAIAAYATDQPVRLSALGVTPGVLRPIDYGIDFYGDTLVMTEAEATQHRRRAAAFVRASLKGWRYAFDHPGEIADLILKMEGVAERGVTRQALLDEAEAMRPYVLPDLVEIGQMNQGRWERIAKQFVVAGMVPKVRPLDGFLFEAEPPLDRRVVIGMISAGTAILLLALGILLWNLQMRRVVRRRTQELRASEEEFRTLANSVPGFVWVGQPDGVISYVNQRWQDYTGLSVEATRVGDWAGILHPEDRAGVINAWAQAVKTGQIFAVECRFRRTDGAYHWYAVRGQPIRDAAGAITKWFGSSTDIEDITKAQMALRERERLYGLVLATTNDVVVMLGVDQVLHYVSEAAGKTFGYRPEELLGKPLSLLQPARLREALATETRRYLGTGEKRGNWAAVQTMGLHRDGHEFPVEVAFADLRTSGEDLFVAFIRDVSERRDAEARRESLEAQLHESQKMQAVGTMAGGIAHEFNNLLGVMLGNVQLARELPDQASQQHCLDQIQEAGQRARELVGQLLAFSRRQPVTRRRCELLPIVRQGVSLLRAGLPARIDIELTAEKDLPWIDADALQIQQLLLNLGTNAAQAMGEGPGVLTLHLDAVTLDAAAASVHRDLKAGRYARLSVSDTGHGMDADTLARIFEPFFTTKSVGEGTGLGLAVVHGIVLAHDGAVLVSSKPGLGTRFELYFPQAGPASTTAVPDEPGTAAALPSHAMTAGRRIMYIDDEEALVVLMKRLLERRGYVVSGFQYPAAALQALRTDPQGFDLVVTDYNMPGMSGLDVARAVHEIRADLPVALSSGYISQELQDSAPAHGVSALIFKAHAVEDYCAMIARLLQPSG